MCSSIFLFGSPSSNLRHFSQTKTSCREEQQNRSCVTSCNRTNRTQVEEENPCTKFFLVTTYRSGSGWLCDALSHHPELWCPIPAELLWDFAFVNSTDESTSERWMSRADQSFDKVCREANSRGKRIAGFKLMYDHVKGPGRDVNGVYLPGAWFQDYLETRNVRILHLVREAAILSMASNEQSRQGAQRLHIKPVFTFHTKKPNISAALMKDAMVQFGEHRVQELLKHERRTMAWWDFLQLTGVPYHFVRYEDLISKKQNVSAYMIFQFLGIKNRVPYPKFQGDFLRTHNHKCEDRVANFDTVKPLIQGTMSERACGELQLIDLL
eukprot:Skav203107  [mRNA]  locus=scaffold447:359945:360919:+ [translate_table: standard]